MAASKTAVSITSLVCVVGVVIGLVALVQSSGGARESGPKKENLSSSRKSVTALCQAAMYRDTCENTLDNAVHNESATTEDLIKAGARVALASIIENFNLTEMLKKQANDSLKHEGAKMAVDDCMDLFQISMKKLENAITKFGDPGSFKDESKTWDLRLWLSDVITYQENCKDGLEGANATEFEDGMRGGMKKATEITMSILDVVTYFSKALSEVGYGMDPNKIIDALQGDGGRRRLLTEMLGGDGLPRWLSKADRQLLNLESEPPAEHNLGGVRVLPNVVVAQDGSGQFESITEAIEAYDANTSLPPGDRFVIYVKAGIYDEQVLVPRKMSNLLMYGDGATKTIVTGKKFYIKDLITTSQTHSFAVQADNFVCKDMGFENTAGPQGHQAVALRTNAGKQVFFKCAFKGYQDTLYAQGGSHFFRDCTISGTIDFIFGNGATIFQHCTIIVRMPMANQFNAITAQGRTGPSMPTGIVIQGCDIKAEPDLDKKQIKTYLGRPWKQYARTVFMETEIGDLISPDGYKPWDEPMHNDTAFYGEYANTGPGAETNARVKWPNMRVLSAQEAQAYTANAFLPSAESWLKASSAPYYLGFKS